MTGKQIKQTIWAAVATLGVAGPVWAGGYDVLIRDGDALPGGGTYRWNGNYPVLNNAGQVAMRTAVPGGQGIFRLDGTTVTPLIRTGDALPGGGTAGTSFERPFLNDIGQIATTTNYTNLDGEAVQVALRSNGNSLLSLFRSGSTSPNGETFHQGTSGRAFSLLSFNDAGTAVLKGDVSTPNGFRPIAITSGDSGPRHLITIGDHLVGSNTTVHHQPSSPRFGLSPINNAGDVAVRAYIYNEDWHSSVRLRESVLVASDTGIRAVASAHSSSGSGTSFASIYGAATLTDDGEIIFWGSGRGGEDNPSGTGFWSPAGGGQYDSLFQSGVAVQGSDLGPQATVHSGLYSRHGAVAESGEYFGIRGTVGTPDDGFAFAYLLRTPDGVRQVMRVGQKTPAGDGEVYVGEWAFAVNSTGQVAFQSRVQRDNRTPHTELHFFDPTLGVIEVAAPHMEIADGSLLRYSWLGDGRAGEEQTGFNEHGQLAFEYEVSLPTGLQESGIALWTPPSVDDLIGGDATLDGIVDLADFGVLRANFGITHGYVTTGDFNGDGLVNLADFGILRANFGSSAGAAEIDAWAATVPEPGARGVLLGGGLLLRRRR